MYCLRCKRKTGDVGARQVAGGAHPRMEATCSICRANKSGFVKKKKKVGAGVGSNLFRGRGFFDDVKRFFS